MTLAEAKARVNKKFTVQDSLTIITLDRQNITIVQATDGTHIYWLFSLKDWSYSVNMGKYHDIK
jgi:hypothetical protein